MLIRRVVPAIVAALGVYAGLAIAAAGLLREHYLTPLVTSSQSAPGTAWILGQSWTKGGRFAFVGNPPNSLISSAPSPSLPAERGAAPLVVRPPR